jgi:hypothetical protein
MHIEIESLEIVILDEPEYEEIVEEEILMPEEVPEPPLTDSAATMPFQGKPWCITPIFIFTVCACIYIYIYIYIYILRVLLV